MQSHFSSNYIQRAHGRLPWRSFNSRHLLRNSDSSLRGWRRLLGSKIGGFTGQIGGRRPAAYGLGLAFWENAGYLGVLGIFSLLSIYLTLSAGTLSSLELYSNLITNRPTLFYPPLQALPLIGFSILERVSSLLFHFCWGYLCLLSASTHNRRYFLLALPMGLLDFFVPFANYFGIPFFELFIYVLGLSTLGLTLFITKEARR